MARAGGFDVVLLASLLPGGSVRHLADSSRLTTRVNVARSLAPFLVIFDSSGKVLATDGQLDGHDPIPPAGVLTSAATNPPDIVTWQPGNGVRIAAVVVPWHGGTVLAGRSLAQVEIRERNALLIALAAWLAMLVALMLASPAAAWFWPASPVGDVAAAQAGRL